MATYTRELLSASVDGKRILLGTALSEVHKPPAGSKSIDEVYMWVSNIAAVPRDLDVVIGPIGDGEEICNAVTLPALSLPIPILTGQCVRNGVAINAQASAVSSLAVTGYVNRITK